MRLLTAADISAVIAHFGVDIVMDRLIDALTGCLRALDPRTTELPARAGFDCGPSKSQASDPTGLVEWMPVHRVGHDVVIKTVSYFADNPLRQRMPTIHANIVRCSSLNGQLLDFIDGGTMTAMRTGAASAVASRLLAHPQSRTLGLVGCGAQAVTQAHALSRIFPLHRVLIYDVNAETEASLARRLAFTGLDVRPAPLSQVEAESDILCTVTSVAVGAGPVISGGALKPHVHINAVGSDYPGKVELPVHVLAESLVVPDHQLQACREGECQQLATDRIGPELHQVVKTAEQFQSWQSRRTVFDSTGIALEDAVALDLIVELARQANIGCELDFDNQRANPMDPYAEIFTPRLSFRSVV